MAAPVNECIPRYEGAYAQKLTSHALVAVTGKRFVGPLGPPQSGPGIQDVGTGGNMQIQALPAAGGDVGGVAQWDAAIGEKVGVYRGAGVVVPVTAGAAVTAGQKVQVDAAGKVIPLAAGKEVGVAMTTAALNADCFVSLNGHY